MPLIEKSFNDLADAITSGQSISMSKTGEWCKANWFVRFIRWIFNLNEGNLRKISDVVASLMDKMERDPLFFDGDSATMAKQQRRLAGYVKVANAVTARLQRKGSKRSVAACRSLKNRVIAMQYRMQSENGGLAKVGEGECEAGLQAQLEQRVAEWKQSQKLYFGEDKNLYDVDKENIRKTCQYPQFVEILLQDSHLQRDFFSWVFKNCNPPEAFIEYPAIAKHLKNCLISGRIGRFAYQNVLDIKLKKIAKNSNLKSRVKVLRLPFNGKKVSILDESKYVKFEGHYITTINAVFKDIKNKNDDPGVFEFIGKKGFRNWSTHRMAHWDAMQQQWVRCNLEEERWWDSLPEFETISKEVLIDRYGIDTLNDDQWLLVACASRQSDKVNIDDCHGYSQTIIPNGNGTWKVYDWGKYAVKFPSGCFQRLGIVGNTVEATFTYPDPNFSYSGFRQQVAVPYIVSEDEGLLYMERIKSNIQKGWDGNFVFMFGFENCAYTPQTDLESVLGKKHEGGRVPNLYIAPLVETGGSQPIGGIIAGIRKSPKWLQPALLRLTEWFFMSWRTRTITDEKGKKIKKSLSTSGFRKGVEIEVDGKTQKVYHNIYVPSALHDRVAKGSIKGVIWTGHQRVQQVL